MCNNEIRNNRIDTAEERINNLEEITQNIKRLYGKEWGREFKNIEGILKRSNIWLIEVLEGKKENGVP